MHSATRRARRARGLLEDGRDCHRETPSRARLSRRVAIVVHKRRPGALCRRAVCALDSNILAPTALLLPIQEPVQPPGEGIHGVLCGSNIDSTRMIIAVAQQEHCVEPVIRLARLARDLIEQCVARWGLAALFDGCEVVTHSAGPLL